MRNINARYNASEGRTFDALTEKLDPAERTEKDRIPLLNYSD